MTPRLLFSVFDKKTSSYAPPFTGETLQSAIRLIDSEVAFQLSQPITFRNVGLSQYPEDFAIYCIASIQLEGQLHIEPISPPDLVIEVSQLPVFRKQLLKEVAANGA